jgi:hypothetical protein
MVIMQECRCPPIWKIGTYYSEGNFTDEMNEHVRKVCSDKGIGKQRGTKLKLNSVALVRK